MYGCFFQGGETEARKGVTRSCQQRLLGERWPERWRAHRPVELWWCFGGGHAVQPGAYLSERVRENPEEAHGTLSSPWEGVGVGWSLIRGI